VKHARGIYWAVVGCLLVLSGYQAVCYWQEQQWLRSKAHAIVDAAGAQTTREKVHALRNHIRASVRYENAPRDDRSFLRDSAQETLESGRGYCGEATRAFIGLARNLDIQAQRVNLHGRANHVLADAEVAPGQWALVDLQEDPERNAFFDAQDRSVDEVVHPDPSLSPYQDCSNVNVRRLPGVNVFVQRIRLRASVITWIAENPSLIKSLFFAGLAGMLVLLFVVDRVLRRFYAFRLGVKLPSSAGASENGRPNLAVNADADTVACFGFEWTQFNQATLSSDELNDLFAKYFDIFPWHVVHVGASGCDFGCGSGRWAKLVAPRVGTLHCIDLSEAAIKAAQGNLSGYDNCIFHIGSIEQVLLPAESMDFGYSLGVLHHVPDTESALHACVEKLKPGAPFLLYLYYDFENRPLWFQGIWRCSDVLRRAISPLPVKVKYWLASVIAATVYWPLARAALLVERLGGNVESLPLSFYRQRSFFVMRTDAFDRFATRVEKRYSVATMRALMEKAGLERITFAIQAPFWRAVGYRQPSVGAAELHGTRVQALHAVAAQDHEVRA
jgi:SAM-dependent methyltransferase